MGRCQKKALKNLVGRPRPNYFALCKLVDGECTASVKQHNNNTQQHTTTHNTQQHTTTHNNTHPSYGPQLSLSSLATCQCCVRVCIVRIAAAAARNKQTTPLSFLHPKMSKSFPPSQHILPGLTRFAAFLGGLCFSSPPPKFCCRYKILFDVFHRLHSLSLSLSVCLSVCLLLFVLPQKGAHTYECTSLVPVRTHIARVCEPWPAFTAAARQD